MTWVFWTAGAAAITAAYSGGLDCSYVIFLVFYRDITKNCFANRRDIVAYCGQQNAQEGFAWVEW